MFWLIIALRTWKKTKALPKPDLNSIDQMARAYGYEVGRGAPLLEVIDAAGDNPFLNPDWREGIKDG